MELNKIYNEDCLIGMKDIPDHSIDCIICDLPYGVLNKTAEGGSWDSVIPFEPLWEQYERVIKTNGAIVLFAQGMFTAQLMMSQPKLWRYNLIWEKGCATGFLNANRCPLRIHEDVVVFYKRQPTYNPQFTKGTPSHSRGGAKVTNDRGTGESKSGQVLWEDKGTQPRKLKYRGAEKSDYPDEAPRNRCYGGFYMTPTNISDDKYPVSIIPMDKEHTNEQWHPTQKPVDLIRYLVRTYSNEGETILDNCMGSGTTAIACIKEKRHFIGFELNKEYYEKACKRIAAEQAQLTLF